MKYPFLGLYGQRAGDYLGLTLAGAVKIAPYTEECLEKALDAYALAAQKAAIRDPLRFYIFLCNDFCKKQQLDPDYPAMTRLASANNIDVSDEVYVPQEERVKIELRIPKVSKNKPGEGNPYRPITHPWKKSAHEFPFSAKRIDDPILDAIKIVGYIGAGIQGPMLGVLPSWQCFLKDAQIQITNLIKEQQGYHLDIPQVLEQTDAYITYVFEKWQDLPHIKEIGSLEETLEKAHQAIAVFVPTLMQPFIEAGLI
jgi:hypothetical protein